MASASAWKNAKYASAGIMKQFVKVSDVIKAAKTLPIFCQNSVLFFCRLPIYSRYSSNLKYLRPSASTNGEFWWRHAGVKSHFNLDPRVMGAIGLRCLWHCMPRQSVNFNVSNKFIIFYNSEETTLLVFALLIQLCFRKELCLWLPQCDQFRFEHLNC